MTKPIISPNLSNDDIHKIREYNYEITKNLSNKEKIDFYNQKGINAQKVIEEIRAAKAKYLQKNHPAD